uniref:Uncharacterized protein n=1 Tax=Arundo donax TaxID=35708 RepID=A0A0A9EK67_ARUDO
MQLTTFFFVCITNASSTQFWPGFKILLVTVVVLLAVKNYKFLVLVSHALFLMIP